MKSESALDVLGNLLQRWFEEVSSSEPGSKADKAALVLLRSLAPLTIYGSEAVWQAGPHQEPTPQSRKASPEAFHIQRLLSPLYRFEKEGLEGAFLAASVCQVIDHLIAQFVPQGLAQWKRLAGDMFTPETLLRLAMDKSRVPNAMTRHVEGVFSLATQKGMALGHRDIGPEHVLLALAAQKGTLASLVLKRLGVQTARLEQQIVVMAEEGEAVQGDTKRVQLAEAMKAASREKPPPGQGLLNTGHLLVGILLAGGNVVDAVLEQQGVTKDQIIAEVRQLDHEFKET